MMPTSFIVSAIIVHLSKGLLIGSTNCHIRVILQLQATTHLHSFTTSFNSLPVFAGTHWDWIRSIGMCTTDCILGQNFVPAVVIRLFKCSNDTQSNPTKIISF
uniref:Senescence-associated family protein n=1 Tax=Rhizophora mucronata TaxID=61149 RepID=A0A2P2JCU6_RHIMU